MKKVRFLFMLIFITMAIVSCNMVEWDKIVSLGETPTLINKVPKIHPGGNAECNTINIVGLSQTTGRNNYIPSTDGFELSWPSGLLVKVENDKSVSFQIDGSINLGDGKCYKVGAVIVKGSDASNVYNYADNGGVTMDKGLVPPTNASGDPAGLSNLTFCFIECKEEEPIVVAVKSYYWLSYDSYLRGDNSTFTVSGGTEYPFSFASEWACKNLGINYFPETSSFYLIGNIGLVTVEEVWTVGIRSLKVKVDLQDQFLLDKTYIYVGSRSGLGTTLCPDWSTWRQDDSNQNIHEYVIPYTDLE